MKFFVDVDNTLCTTGTDYAGATPIQHRIDLVNKLYDAGHHITIYTARGTLSDRKLATELTIRQMKDWGVKYTEISVGEKPVFDFIIDDRAICLNELETVCEHLLSGSEP